MLQLIAAAVFFCGIHFFISGSRLRDILVRLLGAPAFRAIFSLLSLFGLGWLIFAYRQAPYVETWGQLAGFKPVAAALMPLAFLFIVVGVATPSPTVVGGERLLDEDEDEPARGILRITRHPFLWGVSLWALLHLIANGDAASLVLFGSLLLLSLGGTYSIDNKRLRLYGEAWEKFLAVTSVLPFRAIWDQRNDLRLDEIGWKSPALALALYAVAMLLHQRMFGVAPW
jgi:uncharacterized membrane protein